MTCYFWLIVERVPGRFSCLSGQNSPSPGPLSLNISAEKSCRQALGGLMPSSKHELVLARSRLCMETRTPLKDLFLFAMSGLLGHNVSLRVYRKSWCRSNPDQVVPVAQWLGSSPVSGSMRTTALRSRLCRVGCPAASAPAQLKGGLDRFGDFSPWLL